MSNTNATDTIFPAPMGLNYTSGLTVREHFAGLAMQGLISDGNGIRTVNEMATEKKLSASLMLAKIAVAQADALIAALNHQATGSAGSGEK